MGRAGGCLCNLVLLLKQDRAQNVPVPSFGMPLAAGCARELADAWLTVPAIAAVRRSRVLLMSWVSDGY